jgi:hypothetical protein
MRRKFEEYIHGNFGHSHSYPLYVAIGFAETSTILNICICLADSSGRKLVTERTSVP